MIDATCNYLSPYVLSQTTAEQQQQQPLQLQQQQNQQQEDHQPSHNYISATLMSTSASTSSCNSNVASPLGLYGKPASASAAVSAIASHQVVSPMKIEMQYPPQASSTGSASPNSSLSQSAASSASVSPSIFPSTSQSFAISTSPPAAGGSTSATAAAAAVVAAADLGAAAVASAAYGWNTAAYTALPTRTQFPYAQYASDYYGNVATVGVAASASAAWFSHQERLYQPWSSQSYPSFNFDDIAFQTQLQRRSVRCTCPNCTNEMSGLPPIVGPDERGRKQHICHIPGCERLYGKASHLKTHLRWHTGERPFLCLTCGKRFSRSDELQRHGRTHTNYRPYACPICSKKFSRSDHLSKHKKTHFKDKKTKKALAAEAKEQVTAIKQEKSEKALNDKKVIKSTSGTTIMLGNSVQFKQEQPETTNSLGYTPFANIYHQPAVGAGATLTNLPLPPPLFQPQQHSEPPATSHSSSNTNSYEPWCTGSSRPSNNQSNSQIGNRAMEQNQSTSPNVPPISGRSATISRSSSSINSTRQTQHYAALAMQSESQLASEYGLTMSGLASGASDSSSSSCNNSNSVYPGLLGSMKSEYAGNYPPEFSSGSSYGYAHHHSVHAHAHHHYHHHNHNTWTSAYHPHSPA